jgi:hypothetical protein
MNYRFILGISIFYCKKLSSDALDIGFIVVLYNILFAHSRHTLSFVNTNTHEKSLTQTNPPKTPSISGYLTALRTYKGDLVRAMVFDR